MLSRYCLLALLIGLFQGTLFAQAFDSELHTFHAEVLTTQLEHPWGMVFLPNGDLLITERGGRLRMMVNERLLTEPVLGLPAIEAYAQGGLLDIALDPAYPENKRIYLSYVAKDRDGYGTEVMRARFEDGRLSDGQVIFQMSGKTDSGRHFGSRLLFARDDILFITLGDRGKRNRAQDLTDHAGSLIRLYSDGRIPQDNPFLATPRALPEIYTYGNRNMQGIAMHPQTGAIYTHEHGPQGGDELNLMLPGLNYGWPVITYGVNYVIGTKIGEGTEKEMMQQPLHYWRPSIAPSGMIFYNGDMFPKWKGDLLIGSLKFGQLVRLRLTGKQPVHEERILDNAFGRIRDIAQGPEGAVYLLTDERQGKLIRLQGKK